MGNPIQDSSRTEKPFVRQMLQTKIVTIDDTALDAGHTGSTHILRGGLALGKITASGKYKEYNAAGGDGSETGDCILFDQVDLKDGDPGASASDHEAVVMWIGEAVSDHTILYDAALAVDLAKAGGGEGQIEFVAA